MPWRTRNGVALFAERDLPRAAAAMPINEPLLARKRLRSFEALEFICKVFAGRNFFAVLEADQVRLA